MILLKQNDTRTISLTLSESITLSGSVYFLFRMIDGTTKEEVLFTSPSTDTFRDNRFDITLTGSTAPNIDYLNGIVSLNPYGNWSYEIYEQTSPTNLDLTGTTSMIENGLVKVLISDSGNTTNIISEYNGQPDTYNYYQPGQ